MKKHTLTTSDIATIQQVAKELPPVRRHVRRALRGQQLMELGYNDWHGQPIDPAAQYAVDQILEANLVRAITRIAEEEGMQVIHTVLARLKRSASYIDFAGRLVIVNTNRMRPTPTN